MAGKRKASRKTHGDRWASLTTEAVNPRSRRLDALAPADISRLISGEDISALKKVSSAADEIAQAAELFSEAFLAGGRVLYVGAGTSGRLGVIDAAELPPTFGVPKRGKGSALGIMAGGAKALRESVEGAEDDPEAGACAVAKAGVKEPWLVIGISASSMAPYVKGALTEAKRLGARTAFITMNDIAKPKYVDVLIAVDVGPEVLAGSTRMKSGLVTKAILHNISTTAMVLAGKVYGNRMVDLKPWSEKLVARGIRMISELGEVSTTRARKLYEESGRDVKQAIVMARCNCSSGEAAALLERAQGHLRRALAAANE